MSVQDTSVSPVEDENTEAAGSPGVEGSDATAGSSPQDAKPEPSLLDVVKSAVTPAEAEAEGPSSPEAEKVGQAAGTDVQSDEEVDDEKVNPGLHKHPRFRAVLTQRNELREQITALQGPAQQYERIESFMQHNGLTNQHVVELFRVGALMRTDPDQAYEAVADALVELGKLTGRSLPEDLREDVEYGRITEERAAELSRTRARAERAETARETDGQRAEAQAVSQSVGQIRNSVKDWETRTRAADPDFKAKERLIADRVTALATTNGKPRSPDDAVKLIDQAHREITAELKAALGPRREIARSPAPSPSGSAAAAPKTLREAIELAARASG